MNNTTRKRFDEKKLEQSHAVLRAVAHPLRIEILNFINKKEQTNVQSIYHVLDIPQSVTSQQLKILKDAHLVLVKKNRKERLYSINFQLFEKIENALNSFFTDWFKALLLKAKQAIRHILNDNNAIKKHVSLKHF